MGRQNPVAMDGPGQLFRRLMQAVALVPEISQVHQATGPTNPCLHAAIGVPMVHREDVDRFPGSLAQLAGEVGDLRYDALASFLQALSAKLKSDGEADAGRGRRELAALHAASVSVSSAAADIEHAWSICAPRM